MSTKIPRKRATKLFSEINEYAMKKCKESKPEVFDVPFEPGDAIEIVQVNNGGVNSTDMQTVRGVMLGQHKRGLGHGVYIRDMVLGEAIERKIQLYSPLVKSVKILEKNFVKKGKKKIKRAKLYYLRDRPPSGTCI